MKNIEIKFVKQKVLPGLLLLILLLILNIWGFFKRDQLELLTGINKDYFLIPLITSIIITLFFNILFINKILRTEPALILDDEGLTNNSTIVSVNKIYWNNILQIRHQRIGIHNHILIDLKDTISYIETEKNPLKKWIMKSNTERYSTPVMIPHKILDFNIEELIKQLNYRIINHK